MTEKETATQTEMTTTPEPTVGVHAVLKTSDGTISMRSAKTRMDLAKMLLNSPAEILAVYKGKKLAVQQKTSFTFQ